MVIGENLDSSSNVLSVESFTEKYILVIKNIFLEYHSLKKKMDEFMEFQEKPLLNATLPRNSPTDYLLNLDMKGVSNLHKNYFPLKRISLRV